MRVGQIPDISDHPLSYDFRVDSVIGSAKDMLTLKSSSSHLIPYPHYFEQKPNQFSGELPAICSAMNWSEGSLLFPEFSTLASSFIFASF